MKEVLTYLGVAVLTAILFYFFLYLPDTKTAYNNGYTACVKDTVFTPGRDTTIYRDTTIIKEVPVEVIVTDTVIQLASSIDTSWVSGKDTINIQITNVTDLSTKDWEATAEWFMRLEHRDFERAPDTIKIYKVDLDTVEADVAWYRTDIFAYAVVGTIIVVKWIVEIFAKKE